MGNQHSRNVNESHVRIYVNILSIKNQNTRAQMIQTVLAGSEYVITAKQLGIYSHLLNYLASVNAGKQPPLLPYEKPNVNNPTQEQPYRTAGQVRQEYKEQNAITNLVIPPPQTKNYLAKPKNEEKAIGYFQACLEILGLEEEVTLTHDYLKSAYKKAALKHHPDKGGNEKSFEQVTRAYAYLTEILRRINGGRNETSKVDAPNTLKDTRTTDAKQWEHVEPVKLNPNKLDLDAFNKMFEQTRMPDPEEDGYGDWLKDEKKSSSGPTFSGKFNRDVFNQMFEEESKKSATYVAHQPEALIMAPTMGIELGRGKPESYTAPMAANNKNMIFTDLRQAYTTENTFSQQVTSVRVDNRNYEAYKNEYNQAPKPLDHSELEQISSAEKMYMKREDDRRRRAAEEEIQATNYFERMKQLVLTDRPNKSKN